MVAQKNNDLMEAEDLVAIIMAKMLELSHEFEERITAEIKDMVCDAFVAMDSKIAGMGDRVEVLLSNIEKEVEVMAEVQNKISKVKKKLVMDEDTCSESKWMLRSADWERLPDPATLRINMDKMARKSDVQKSIRPWLSKAI